MRTVFVALAALAAVAHAQTVGQVTFVAGGLNGQSTEGDPPYFDGNATQSRLSVANNASALKSDHIDGTGTSASFRDNLYGILAFNGEVFVGDEVAVSRIQFTPNATVTTLAGKKDYYFTNADNGTARHHDGIGTIAHFASVTGLAMKSTDSTYLFVTDGSRVTPQTAPATASGAIKKILLNTGVLSEVTSFAGNQSNPVAHHDGAGATARFYYPSGIVFDASNTLYINDFATIRSVLPDGRSRTLAGLAGSPGYADGRGTVARHAGAGQVQVSEDGTRLYVGHQNGPIRVLHLDDPQGVSARTHSGTFKNTTAPYWGSFYADGSKSQAIFYRTQGLALDFGDSTKPLYVSSNHFTRPIDFPTAGFSTRTANTARATIRKVTPDGQATSFAGSASAVTATVSSDGQGNSARFASIAGLAIDFTSRYMYINNNRHSIVQKVALDSASAGPGSPTPAPSPAPTPPPTPAPPSPAPTSAPTLSTCAGRCGSIRAFKADDGTDCNCDAGCPLTESCCAGEASFLENCPVNLCTSIPLWDVSTPESAATFCDYQPAVGAQGTSVPCSCNLLCATFGDCCADYEDQCTTAVIVGAGLEVAAALDQATGSCRGFNVDGDETSGSKCGFFFPQYGNSGSEEEEACHCDRYCLEAVDCCDDYNEFCALEGSCAPAGRVSPCDEVFEEGATTQRGQNKCGCDNGCVDIGDCCSDYNTFCVNLPAALEAGATCDGHCEPKGDNSNNFSSGEEEYETRVDFFWPDGTASFCHCDAFCNEEGDCCPDYFDECRLPPSQG